jgi:hypothetical protein
VSGFLGRFAQRIPNPLQLDADVIPLQEQITGTSGDILALLWAAIISGHWRRRQD